MKGVRAGSQSGPWSLVVIDMMNKKVVHQETVEIRDAIPAVYEHLKKQFPNYFLSIEDNGGQQVYQTKLNVQEGLGNLMTKFSQGLEGRFKKQKELKSALEVYPDNIKSALLKAYQQEIAFSAGVGTFIKQATPENALEVAQEATSDPNGLGKLTQKDGLLVYIPAGA